MKFKNRQNKFMVKTIRTLVVSGSGQGWPERGDRELPTVIGIFYILIWAMVIEVNTSVKIH